MILNTESPRWNEFLNILRKELNFHYSEKAEDIIWNCEGNFALAREILKYLGGINEEETINDFIKNGAECDCEIIFILEYKIQKGEKNESS
jgi:hypothetical protein